MKTIYKYPLPIGGAYTLQLPIGAQVLDVQDQHGAAQLWALVDSPTTGVANRTFAIYGTGHAIPDVPMRHISTFQQSGGNLVWHAFELLLGEMKNG